MRLTISLIFIATTIFSCSPKKQDPLSSAFRSIRINFCDDVITTDMDFEKIKGSLHSRIVRNEDVEVYYELSCNLKKGTFMILGKKETSFLSPIGVMIQPSENGIKSISIVTEEELEYVLSEMVNLFGEPSISPNFFEWSSDNYLFLLTEMVGKGYITFSAK